MNNLLLFIHKLFIKHKIERVKMKIILDSN